MPSSKSRPNDAPIAQAKHKAKTNDKRELSTKANWATSGGKGNDALLQLESSGIPSCVAKQYSKWLTERGFDCEAALRLVRKKDLEDIGMRLAHQKMLLRFMASKHPAKKQGHGQSAIEPHSMPTTPPLKRPASCRLADLAWRQAPSDVAPLLAPWLSFADLMLSYRRISHAWGAAASSVLKNRVTSFMRAMWDLPQLISSRWDVALIQCGSPRDMQVFKRLADNDPGMTVSIRLQVKPITALSRSKGTTSLRCHAVCDRPQALPGMYEGMWPKLTNLFHHTLGFSKWKMPDSLKCSDNPGLKLQHSVFIELPYVYAPPVLPSGLRGTSSHLEKSKKRLCIDFHVIGNEARQMSLE